MMVAPIGAKVRAEGANPTVQPDLLIDIAGDEAVGSLKAGTLCLPSGSLRGGDFVDDAEALQRILTNELVRLGGNASVASLTSLGSLSKISLTHISATLCARRYGVFGTGDKRSLSGKAQFRFEYQTVRQGSKVLGLEVITIEVNKKSPRTTQQIMQDAIRELAVRLSRQQ